MSRKPTGPRCLIHPTKAAKWPSDDPVFCLLKCGAVFGLGAATARASALADDDAEVELVPVACETCDDVDANNDDESRVLVELSETRDDRIAFAVCVRCGATMNDEDPEAVQPLCSSCDEAVERDAQARGV
jgi:hypothetical protein